MHTDIHRMFILLSVIPHLDLHFKIDGYVMKNKNELLDDSWEDGPGDKDVKRKHPIQMAIEYIREYKSMASRRRMSQSTGDDYEMEEVDAHSQNNDDPEGSTRRQPREYTLSIENTPKHPIQLMVHIHIKSNFNVTCCHL